MRATIVSCMPRPIISRLPGVVPEFYSIDAAPENSFSTLVVEDGFFFLYQGDGRHVKIDESGDRLAKSIVDVYCTSQLEADSDARPGLFVIPGAPTKADILKNHQKELEAALKLQLNWFRKLVVSADNFWNKFRQHGGISDLQREACKILQLDREWKIVIEDAPAMCPACGIKLPHSAVMRCPTCTTIIKPKEYQAAFGGELVGAK